MDEKKELFTLGTREDLARLEDKGFEVMYEELDAIGTELGDAFDSMIYALYERGTANNFNLNDVSSTYRTYTEYYRKYIDRFGRIAVGQVEFDGVDLQLFLNRAESLPYINGNRTNRQLRMMQCYGIMTGVTRFVNQLYLSFIRPDAPVYKYAQDGARHLGGSGDGSLIRFYFRSKMRWMTPYGTPVSLESWRKPAPCSRQASTIFRRSSLSKA